MNSMIQIKVETSEAETFIRHIETMGYEVCRVRSGDSFHVNFKVDGRTSIDYMVTICDDCAYIGVRPAVVK